VSWFQLLPEGELLSSSSPSLTRKERTWQDLAALQVMRAHMSLQEEGHFSTWTLSEDKVKLWLFLPGRHESFNSATTHTAINGLKVVGQGLWCAPGDCNDVSNALSQALKNRCERAFQSLSYVRFGNVFVKCRRQGASDPSLRKPLPSCELVFTASEEAIFVHVLVRRKCVEHLVRHS
jgi:mediator of RNA polymerase II transcription subunit 13